MAEYRIDLDVRQTASTAAGVIDRAIFPLLHQALRMIANATAERWITSVHRAKLWSEEKKEYAESIKWEMVDDLNALVFSDYSKAQEIEDGRPARDLKKMLDTSDKVRVSKKGKRYLVIPMRFSTPGNDAHGPAMPKAVYLAAKNLKPSKIIGQGTRLSGHGAFDMKTRQRIGVTQNRYTWGEKLVGEKLGKKHQGMYRFDTTTPGGRRSSTYLSFRTMVEGSKGWIVPPQPGLHIVKDVVQGMRPVAQKIVEEAVRRSITPT